jgi:hypothetical protein
MGKEGTRMTSRERSGLNFCAHAVGQLQQANGVGDMAPRFSDGSAKLLLSQAELLYQARKSLRFLDRIQVLPL